jgi:prepilin-type N-terminal cleavage/methylation domain-containing protein
MTPRPTGRRAGFTLTEMVVVMWALGIALGLGTQLLIAATRAGALAEGADTRAARRGELGRVFRDDAARAEAAPDKLGDAAAGPQRLFLRLTGGTVVTYEWADSALLRTERTGDAESRQTLPLSSPRVRVEFPRPANGLATLRLIETLPNGTEVAADVSAALGGDVR